MFFNRTEEVMKTQEIRIEDYNYSLPDERIAKFPLPKRDESKLLLYRNGEISESIFKHITDYLPQNTLMVFNNTRVINRAHTDLNVVIGLCVGHDSLFYKYADAYSTTLITKDRVTGHNPAAALYTANSYYRKKLMPDNK